MQLVRASAEQFEIVRDIVRETVEVVYTRYYPRGAVDFFLDHHNDDRIREDIGAGRVYLLESDGTITGTASVRENEIYRLFIRPEFQGRGYGRAVLDILEKMIFDSFETIGLDASLPALSMYRNRGYREIEYYKEEMKNGDFLCWYEMEKKRDG